MMRLFLSCLLLSMLLLTCGCSALPFGTGLNSAPPVLALEEAEKRPYIKIGRINIRRTVYINDYAMSPNLQEWAVEALQHEAEKLGADAVILPEISSRELSQVGLPSFPATEYKAAGTAIRFKP